MMDDLFPFLVAQAWQVALLAVVVWIVVKTCCKRRPHLGHALWLLVLIKCVVPPVFSSSTGVYSWLLKDELRIEVANRIEVELSRATMKAPQPITVPVVPIVEPTALAQPRNLVATPAPKPVFQTPTVHSPPKKTNAPISKRVATAFVKPVAKIKQSPIVPTVTSTPVVRRSQPAPQTTTTASVPIARIWQAWIVKAWLTGVALFLAVTLLRFLRFRSWIGRQESIEHNDIESQVTQLATELKLRRRVRIKVVDAEFGPAIMGLFRPTIVLPHSLVADKTTEELEPMLAHELIHFRRGDTYWSVLQVIACSLMWFHPLVWLASRNVTRESERCCDEETIANFNCDRANYARMLVDILEQKSRLRIAPVVPGVRPADVTSSRLEQIMESDSGKRRRTPRWVWALMLVAAIAVIPGAALVQSQERRVTADAPKVVFKDTVVVESVSSPPMRANSFQSQPSSPPVNRIAQLTQSSNGSRPKPQTATPIQATPYAADTLQVQNSFTRFDDGGFNPEASWKKVVNKVVALTDDEEERKKIVKELEDHVWRTSEALEHLSNLKIKPVDLEMRLWIAPVKAADEVFEETTLNLSELFPKWCFAEQQISQEAYEELVERIGSQDDLRITSPELAAVYLKNKKQIAALLSTPMVTGVEGISILDPASVKARRSPAPDCAALAATLVESNEDSVALEGQLSLTKMLPLDGRKLPLKLGDQQFEIENSIAKHSMRHISWNIPKDKIQVLRARFSDMPEFQMVVFVKAMQSSAPLKDGDSITLEYLTKIKKDFKEVGIPAIRFVNISVPNAPEQLILVPMLPDRPPEDSKEPTPRTKPLSLSLHCGNDAITEDGSISTTLKLANNTTLAIEGDIESQQISAGSVQIRGRNFIFKNEDEDSFSAKADQGNISFSRSEALEKTMQLSLQSNASLQFAGIEFAADTINCFPTQIEAIGNVKVRIPEIESKVTAARVILNLESLAFDFDGAVAVERKVEGTSFPFLLKSNHVGWSLVTGEMQTDKRYSSPRQSTASRFGTSTPSRFELRPQVDSGQ